ncbi:MAG: general secretion pathway protein GspL [Rhodoferax sp.]|jgi:general secretion pathway protein L|uniref:type II secretion system protein GspL n=1 Tax=Rhodoferax sp. TaxID=50421 RepID=UPI001B6BACE6|nr:type II secretion system protein GspL [Rhodoferax sp.]MBP8285356.1 general secretion pathway protein GspL [Rhodoferax sp.]MBP9147828.1 general secretion pathway protein GspL [Rhodoferax sp.]MBP9737441.1 general secretion pathway protein GspL [Rhodoferax sp.]
MSQLIVYLPPESADPKALFEYVLSPDGGTVAGHARVPLALLPVSTQHEVVLVLPAQWLSWHQITLPPGSLPRQMLGERSSTRLRSILEGLLEDQLLDEPAQLHFALQPQPATGVSIWVVTTAREAIHAALKSLAQAGHEVARIVPELTVQALVQSLYVTERSDGAQMVGLLRSDQPNKQGVEVSSVLVCPMTAESIALLEPPITAGSNPPSLPAEDKGRPERLQVVAEPVVSQRAEQLFHKPVVLQQRSHRLLEAAQSAWDLAQFDLAHARRDRRLARWGQGARSLMRAPEWRAARWSLLAIMAANLVGLNFWALREQSALQVQRQQIRAVLTQTFPKIPVVVDAPVQMAREVARLQRTRPNPAGADLEAMLSTFSALAPTEYSPQVIEYVGNELRLVGPGLPAAQQLELIKGLQSRGLVASVQGDGWVISAGANR